MTDPSYAPCLDSLARHLRECAAITQDPTAKDILTDCARALDARAQELRTRELFLDRVQRANEPEKIT